VPRAAGVRHAPAFDDDEARQMFDALPDTIRVYRGCSRAPLCGLAWSLDRHVAVGFARGHRRIAAPDPIIVGADLRKGAIFALINERSESETVLDPRKIGNLRIEDMPQSAAA
jgi:hypothetical protein